MLNQAGDFVRTYIGWTEVQWLCAVLKNTSLWQIWQLWSRLNTIVLFLSWVSFVLLKRPDISHKGDAALSSMLFWVWPLIANFLGFRGKRSSPWWMEGLRTVLTFSINTPTQMKCRHLGNHLKCNKPTYFLHTHLYTHIYSWFAI